MTPGASVAAHSAPSTFTPAANTAARMASAAIARSRVTAQRHIAIAASAYAAPSTKSAAPASATWRSRIGSDITSQVPAIASGAPAPAWRACA